MLTARRRCASILDKHPCTTMNLVEAPLAIVDLETTGTRPAADRVTEIAVLEIERFAVVSEWSTLVNPGVPVPSEIQALTGISHQMLAEAPRFADLAQELHERLAGRVFIAHNARFDYGFLRREFDRAGIKFHARAVCSVKLARRLYPRERGHDLDSLIARHGIACQARHRAMGDADALWQFLRIAAKEHGEAVLKVARLVKQLAPLHNRQLRRPERLCGFVFDGRRLRLAAAAEIDADTLPYVYGVFRTRRAALQMLRALADEHSLCLQTLGFDAKRQGACFRHQIGRCFGVCASRESIHAHHGRLATALATLKTPAWPYPGPVGIVESAAARDTTEVHAVDRWCYLGAARCEPEMADLLDERPRFDYDQYRILSRYLEKCVATGAARVVPLQKCTAS